MEINNLPDIYNISEAIQTIEKKYIEEDDSTLILGIYGYLNEVFSNVLQNSIYVASEYGNEALPIRSKFEKTILTNAITYNIQDINAIPAKMTVMIGFVKSTIDKYIDNNGKFVLDRHSNIAIEKYNFHLDYDIIISRNKLMNGNIIYSAKYDMNFDNTLSDVENPYLQSPIISKINGDEYLFIICKLRQTSLDIVSNKIITDNILESKTFDFTFTDQLCGFNIYCTENDVRQELIPVYEGMPYDKSEYYCYYTYLNSNTIRVKFDRDSYQPSLNAVIEVEIFTTLGIDGNFEYNELLLLPLSSNTYDYSYIKAVIKPMTPSTNGCDRKTVSELQRIIPKRMLARAGIINTKDLQNYFDMIDSDNRLIIYKKRDNQIERLYYAYLLAKDDEQNIIPTNTIDITLDDNDFDSYYEDRCVILPGRKVYYDKGMMGYYKEGIIKDDENLKECENGDGSLIGERHAIFEYTSPFIIVVNRNPLSISYYLDLINREYVFNYDYINQKSILQFIATSIYLYKNYLYSDDYVFTMSINQNIDDKDLIVMNEDNEIDQINISPVLVVTSNNVKYYTIGDIIDYSNGKFTIEFRISVNKNKINNKNQIECTNMILNTQSSPNNTFIDSTINASVYIYAKKGIENVSEDEEFNSDISIPSLDSTHILLNKYIIRDDIELLYNYSTTINSVVKIINDNPDKVNKPDENGMYHYLMKSVPLVRYDYLLNNNRLNDFIDYIKYRKAYIDGAQVKMEDSFNIDLKFFNTYGPSRLFTIGRHNQLPLDKVNLSLNFTIKFKTITDLIPNIKDSIKEYIENINELENIHMNNLCMYIKSLYPDIDFIEFNGLNTYNANYQYIERKEPDVLSEVPEFVSINLIGDNMEPDINITVI